MLLSHGVHYRTTSSYGESCLTRISLFSKYAQASFFSKFTLTPVTLQFEIVTLSYFVKGIKGLFGNGFWGLSTPFVLHNHLLVKQPIRCQIWMAIFSRWMGTILRCPGPTKLILPLRIFVLRSMKGVELLYTFMRIHMIRSLIVHYLILTSLWTWQWM